MADDATHRPVEPPLPPADAFPRLGEETGYEAVTDGRAWKAVGIAPEVAVLFPVTASDRDRESLRVTRDAGAKAAQRAAPVERAAGLVRFVPGIAVRTGAGTVHAAEGITTPVSTLSGIRFAIYIAPVDASAAELVYHEAVHLHAAEGRTDPAVFNLFQGAGFDEFDAREGIARYRPGRRAEERLATIAGRILGAGHNLPRADTGPGSAALRSPRNVHHAGDEDALDGEGRGSSSRRLLHPSLTHPSFLRFLDDLESGRLGLLPSDPVRRETAVRRLGSSGLDDPLHDKLPRYSVGNPTLRTTAAAARNRRDTAADERSLPASEAAMEHQNDRQPRLSADSNTPASLPADLARPDVRRALRPVLDTWWTANGHAVAARDPGITSADALLTDPATPLDSDLRSMREDLVRTITASTGPREEIVTGTGESADAAADRDGHPTFGARAVQFARTNAFEIATTSAIAAATGIVGLFSHDRDDTAREILEGLPRFAVPGDREIAGLMPTPELADASIGFARELGAIARQLQLLDIDLPETVAAKLGQFVDSADRLGGPASIVGNLPDAAALQQSLAGLPAESAQAAREALTAYIEVLLIAYNGLDAVHGPAASGYRAVELLAWSLELDLPTRFNPAYWPPELPDLEPTFGFSGPSDLSAVQDSAIVERLRDAMGQGLDTQGIAELAVSDALPGIQARFETPELALDHLALLLDQASRPPTHHSDGIAVFGDHAAAAASSAFTKLTTLAEPLGHATAAKAAQLIDAVAQAGQGVLYSAKETGLTAGARPSESGGLQTSRAVDDLHRRRDRHRAVEALDGSLRAAGVSDPIRETMLLSLGRIAGDPAEVRRHDDPALLALRRHAVQSTLEDLAAGVPPFDKQIGRPDGRQGDDRQREALNRVLERALAVLDDAIPRAERQQARRDLDKVARDSGLGDSARGLRPVLKGFIAKGGDTLRDAVMAGVARRQPEAMRLAARDAGLPGPYFVVSDADTVIALMSALHAFASDPRRNELAKHGYAATGDTARQLVAGTAGAPAGVLSPAETTAAMMAAAAQLAIGPSAVAKAVASIAPAYQARSSTFASPPVVPRPQPVRGSPGLQR